MLMVNNKRNAWAILQKYVPMVPFIANIIGSQCEVVLHDVTEPGNSIIAIRNGYISGRSVGGPLTDLGLKLMSTKTAITGDSLINYASRTCRGEALVSSTYYIRDEAGELIGMLCVNILNDIHTFRSCVPERVKSGEFQAAPATMALGSSVDESLYTSADQVISQAVKGLLDKNGITAERLTFDEKKELISQLQSNGIFQIKGAVNQVADELDIAVSTVYRYLSCNKKLKEMYDNGN